MAFREIEAKSLLLNPFVMLDDDWALLSAGHRGKFNTMTISWGNMGIMWGKPILTVVVRPGRYTKEFIDALDLFTVSFYSNSYRKALELLGSKSGRDSDKITESALTPLFIDDTVAFEEAQRIFLCRKLFGGQQLDAAKFVDKSLDPAIYPDKDYHYFYIGEIVKVLEATD